MLLSLPDDILEEMMSVASKSTNSAGQTQIKVTDGEMFLCMGDKVMPLSMTAAGPSPLHLYRMQQGSNDADTAMVSQGVVSTRLSLKTSTSLEKHQSSSAAATAAATRLREMRKEEAARKQNSRAVMLDQSQFDKKGRLAATATPYTAVGRSRSGTPATPTSASPRIGSSSSSVAATRNISVSNPRSSSPAVVLGRGASPATAMTGIASPSTSTPGPSLRQQIIHTLAAGPQTRQHVVEAIPRSPEASIARLLPLLAAADVSTGASSSPSPLFTLKDEVYKEVAAAIAAGTWPVGVTEEDKTKIAANATQAFERIKLNRKAQEWKTIAKWADAGGGGGMESEQPRARLPTRDIKASSGGSGGDNKDASSSSSKAGSVTVTSRRATSASSTSPEPPTLGDPLASSSSSKKKTTSTRDRLARAVKGRGPRGEDLKRQQEKERRRLERLKAEADAARETPTSSSSKVNDGDITRTKRKRGAEDVIGDEEEVEDGERRAHSAVKQGQSTSGGETARPTPKHQASTASKKSSSPPPPPSSSSSTVKKRKSEVEPPTSSDRKYKYAPTDGSPASDRKRKSGIELAPERGRVVRTDSEINRGREVNKEQKRERKTAADSDTHEAKTSAADEKRRPRANSNSSAINEKKDARDGRDDDSTAAAATAAAAHHGPSASASLLNAEPWLDVRTNEEWTRLAMRFRRVWAQYSETTSRLETEKARLQVERQRAERQAALGRTVAAESVTPAADTPIHSTTPLPDESPQTRDSSRLRRREKPRSEELEEGEEEEGDDGDDNVDGEASAPTSPRAPLLPSTYSWRDDAWDEDVHHDNGRNSTSYMSHQHGQSNAAGAPAAPMSLEELARLVADQQSREGELRRMKDALRGWQQTQPIAV